MMEDMRSAVELAHLPTGPHALERELLDAETTDVADIATVARLLSMANAAFVVADAGIDGIAAPWYREIGLRLLRRSMEGLNVIEAHREPRPAAGLN
jgi:hypothetical protein